MTDLSAAASAATIELSHAELHGTVCGMLVGLARGALEAGHAWQFSVQDYVDLVGADSVSDWQAVEDFAGLALANLDSEDLAFSPLLPDEDDGLAERVGGLGEWCAAFLAGYGAAEGPTGTEATDEILDDFVAISSVDANQVDGDDDAERQLMELEEYVKVGVLLLMRPANPEEED